MKGILITMIIAVIVIYVEGKQGYFYVMVMCVVILLSWNNPRCEHFYRL